VFLPYVIAPKMRGPPVARLSVQGAIEIPRDVLADSAVCGEAWGDEKEGSRYRLRRSPGRPRRRCRQEGGPRRISKAWGEGFEASSDLMSLDVNRNLWLSRVDRYSIDALRSIGPVGHRHINFRGTYRFPVERYADRLVASAA
jgi:hypothetical protein